MFIKFNNAIRTELQLAGKLPICVSKSVFSSICFLLPSPTSLYSVSIVYDTALHSCVKNWLQSINLSSMLEITLPKLRTTQSTIDIWVKNIFTTTAHNDPSKESQLSKVPPFPNLCILNRNHDSYFREKTENIYRRYNLPHFFHPLHNLP